MSDQRGTRPIHVLNVRKAELPLESRNEGVVINLRGPIALPLLPFLSSVYTYLSLTRRTFDTIHHLFPIPGPFAFLRGTGNAITRLLHLALIFTFVVHFILSGILGITSHMALQAQSAARNTRAITLAVCALPIPFKDIICTRIGSEPLSPFSPDADHSPAWYPFLINEDVHGPAVDFAIHKAANTTCTILALVRASDLSQRHELSDKLKDFLQHVWTCELASGAHLALVKTTIDE